MAIFMTGYYPIYLSFSLNHYLIFFYSILQFNFLILQSGWTKLCNICQIFSYIIWITSTFLRYWIPGICCSFKYSASFSAYSQPLWNIWHYIQESSVNFIKVSKVTLEKACYPLQSFLIRCTLIPHVCENVIRMIIWGISYSYLHV